MGYGQSKFKRAPANSSMDPSTSSIKRIFVVRHGERADEVYGSEWSLNPEKGREYDPPLTPTGHQQAAEAGRLLHGLIPSDVHGDVRCIYASTMLRCLETGAQIAKVRMNHSMT